MNEIFIREVKMPITIRGFTVPDEDGDFNIYINNCLSEEAKAKSLRHEKQHIEQNDFMCAEAARVIEEKNT